MKSSGVEEGLVYREVVVMPWRGFCLRALVAAASASTIGIRSSPRWGGAAALLHCLLLVLLHREGGRSRWCTCTARAAPGVLLLLLGDCYL